jgi:hypothetical protein
VSVTDLATGVTRVLVQRFDWNIMITEAARQD